MKQRRIIYKRWRKIFKQIIIKVRSKKLGVFAALRSCAATAIQSWWRKQKIDLKPVKHIVKKKRMKKKVKTINNKQEKEPKKNSRLNSIMTYRLTETQIKKLLMECVADNPFLLLHQGEVGAPQPEPCDNYEGVVEYNIADINEKYVESCMAEFKNDYKLPPKKAKSAGGKKIQQSHTRTALDPYVAEGCHARNFGGRRCGKPEADTTGGGGDGFCGLHKRGTESYGVLGDALSDKLRKSMKLSKTRMGSGHHYATNFQHFARWKEQEGEDWVTTHLKPIWTSVDKNKYFYNTHEEFLADKAKFEKDDKPNPYQNEKVMTQEEKDLVVAVDLQEQIMNEDVPLCAICADNDRNDEDYYRFWACDHEFHKDCGKEWRMKDKSAGTKICDGNPCPTCRAKPMKKMKKCDEPSKFE